MLPALRLSALTFGVVAGLSIAVTGCDTGGLLIVEHKPGAVVQGPSVNEMVSGGTFASNGKYRLFYSTGQPTPNQGVSSSPGSTLHGGLVGAAHGN